MLKDEVLQIRLTENDKTIIKILSSKRNVTITEFVMTAITCYLEDMEEPMLYDMDYWRDL